MEERAATPFILSMLGGLFDIAGTIMGFIYLPTYSIYPYSYLPPYYVPFLVTSGVCGILVLLASYFLYVRPQLHVAWGVMILVLSVAGVFAVVTGYYALFGVIGLIFGLLGGAMAIAWRGNGALGHPGSLVRLCLSCGRYVPMSFPYCSYCGTPAPVVRPQPAGAPPAAPPGTPPPP